VELWFPEQVVTVLAHPVQSGEYRLVVHAFALNVEERPLAKRVIDSRQRRRRRPGRAAARHHPMVAARVVVQVVSGWYGDHGHGHYRHQCGHQH